MQRTSIFVGVLSCLVGVGLGVAGTWRVMRPVPSAADGASLQHPPGTVLLRIACFPDDRFPTNQGAHPDNHLYVDGVLMAWPQPYGRSLPVEAEQWANGQLGAEIYTLRLSPGGHEIMWKRDGAVQLRCIVVASEVPGPPAVVLASAKNKG